jgi:hypothetical protein
LAKAHGSLSVRGGTDVEAILMFQAMPSEMMNIIANDALAAI